MGGDFCHTYDLKSFITEPPCYKSPKDPTFIDLFLTNHPRRFQNSCSFETVVSDRHDSECNESIFPKATTRNNKL